MNIPPSPDPKLTSAAFRQAHKIVFEAKILLRTEVEVPTLKDWNAPAGVFRDTLDLNGNGNLDFQCQTRYADRSHRTVDDYITATEPSLEFTYSSMKARAGELGHEVLTQDDFPELKLQYEQTHYHLSYREKSYVNQHEVEREQPAREVAAEIAAGLPGAVGARWGIDCSTNSFVLYVP